MEMTGTATLFAVLMKRDWYDFETGEPMDEEYDIKTGAIAERPQLMNLWSSQGWETVQELDPEDDPGLEELWKWEVGYSETIDGEDLPPWGTDYLVEGLSSHDENGSISELKILLHDADVALWYDSWADPPGPDDYWPGWDPGEDLAFETEEHDWSPEQRAEWGGKPWRQEPGLVSVSSFKGPFPMVEWTQYWLQAEDSVPPQHEVIRTYLLLAASIKYGEDHEIESEKSWTGTLRFVVGGNDKVSETAPEVTWNGTAPPGTWVETETDGTGRCWRSRRWRGGR